MNKSERRWNLTPPPPCPCADLLFLVCLTSSVCFVSELIKMLERWRGGEKAEKGECDSFQDVWRTLHLCEVQTAPFCGGGRGLGAGWGDLVGGGVEFIGFALAHPCLGLHHGAEGEVEGHPSKFSEWTWALGRAEPWLGSRCAALRLHYDSNIWTKRITQNLWLSTSPDYIHV